ncbi:MAG TPA: regulatory iron-sulfur-containing complex subunit RicT [Gemmatimonadales bacterium]
MGTTVVEVRFKGNRKGFYTLEADEALGLGDAVVVAAERGEDLGYVSAVGDAAARKCGVGCAGCAIAEPKEPSGKVLRPASPQDSHISEELRKAEEDVRRKVMERVRHHRLDMKVSDAEWQWDRKKLTVYFTAEKRVDFRGLVRDLASLFRTRIELRQIGARDEARRLDGVGRCGRQYCCSSWLTELRPVSLSLAKDQRLSLNPTQISGGCGRLLCCLRYEHEFYVTSRKRFPKEGKILQTEAGTERVVAVDIFRERVLLAAENGANRTVTLAELKREVAAGRRPDERPPRGTEAPAERRPEAATTPEQPADAVAPRRRRHRRRGRGRSRPRGGTDEAGGKDQGDR